MVSDGLLAEATLKMGIEDLFFGTGMFAVLIILSALILANILRRKIPFMRRSMMPTALIGGLLLMIIRAVLQLFGLDMFNLGYADNPGDNMLYLLVYHLLPIGFIALGLRDKQTHEGGEHITVDEKNIQTHPVRTGAMIVNSYMMQAVLGIGLTLFLGLVFFKDVLYPGSGIILPLGFGQGPGQATNGGQNFQDAGMVNGRAFGIAIASIGMIWASIGGVILLNRIAKKRGISLKETFQTAGDTPSGLVEEADEIPLSESVDKFTIQMCLIGFIYVLTMLFCWFLDWALSFLGTTGEDIANVFWGFNFCFGVAFAMLFKLILNRLRKRRLMKRKYVNNYMLNRISGFAFDIMVIASLASLELASLGQLWIPLLIITTAGGFATVFYTRFICNKLYPGYKDEAFITMYGMLTGTLSNGIILLREIDPDFKTPAAMDQIIGSATALIFGVPMLILIPFAMSSPGYYIVFGVCAVYFVFLLWAMFGKFGWLTKLFKRKKKAAVTEATAGGTAENGNASEDNQNI